MTAMTEQRSIDEAFGELRAGIHITGYSFERAVAQLAWLLKEGRWKRCRTGYQTIDAFMRGIRIEDHKLVAEARKKIAALIKAAEPKVSNRAIAKAVGAGSRTIDRDVAPNGAVQGKKTSKNKGGGAPNGANAPLAGYEAARVVARAERVKDQQQSVNERTAKVILDARKLGKFSVILADPPWDDEFGASNRSIENHYPTMKFEDILALPINQIAHEQAMLFLWATPSMIEMALETAKAWRFQYRTQLVWVKPSIGLGKYVRQRHEILLICRRGDHPAPLGENLPDSVIEAPRSEHSEKPEVFHEIIERMYPEAERVELFRRGSARQGWSAWGAEAKEAAE
jgi:N6-adenosine-specific RNA methylase IME4